MQHSIRAADSFTSAEGGRPEAAPARAGTGFRSGPTATAPWALGAQFVRACIRRSASHLTTP